METVELKRIIQEQEKEREQLLKGSFTRRDVDMGHLENSLKAPNVLAILGIRRCGKSVLSWMLMGGRKYGYVNFDDEALYGFKTGDFNKLLRAFYELYGDVDYLVFDEMHNIPGWELFITRLRRTKKIIVTGSNSHMLSGELATHLTGRHTDFVLYPFSFREFCRHMGHEPIVDYTTKTAASAQRLLDDYLRLGGLPESYSLGRPLLTSIFGDIVERDIKARYNIRGTAIEALAKYLATNISNEITFNRLKEPFGIKKYQTLARYMSHFRDAYLFFMLERFSYKLKEQFKAPKKVYCMDTGLVNAVSFKTSENFGAFFENAVAVELLRRGQEIYYWKNERQEEVDFLVKGRKGVEQLIQVCYDAKSQKTMDREVRSLMKAGKELNCNNLMVITRDHEAESTSDNKISFIPLWKWLLEDRIPTGRLTGRSREA